MPHNIKISNVPCQEVDVHNDLWATDNEIIVNNVPYQEVSVTNDSRTTDNDIVINNVPSQEVGVNNNPSVSCVNGYAGVVSLTQDDIPAGKKYVPYSKEEQEKLAKLDESSGGVNFVTDETLNLSNGVLSVNTAQSAEADNTLPITAAAVYTQIGNIEILLKTI